MRSSFLPFSPPSIGEDEIAEVVDTLRSGWITTGPKVRRFEEEFARFVEAPAALATSSCTAAMEVALAALGIGPGDAVISTPMTFCSTIHVIERAGAQPVLVDVEPDTLNIDPDRVEAALRDTPNARAILPVHLYGHPCELGSINALAREHGLAVVQDAAHALPSRYDGCPVGSVPEAPPTLVAFSFYATKNLTTAEGGMLTGPADTIERARPWGLHGMSSDAHKRYSSQGTWRYEVIAPGFKCNMTDIQAALGLHQLRRLPELQSRRRSVVERYTGAFSAIPELELPVERSGVEHAWHIYPLRLRLDALGVDRSAFIEELRRLNVGASVHFIPVHLHRYYRERYGFRPDDFEVAGEAYRRLVSLPLYPGLTDQDVEDVIDAVATVVARHRR